VRFNQDKIKKMNKISICFLFALLFVIVSTANAKPDSLQVIFDHNGGFYSNSFELKMNVPDESFSIVYTIDGSNPQTSSTIKDGGKSVSLTIDPNSINGRPKTPGYIVRASLKKDSIQFPLTQTYLFLNEVINQTNPSGGFPESEVNGQIIDLDMTKVKYSNLLVDALKDIPSISIVTDLENLFDSNTGIYVNALNNGKDWERFCSVELLNPNGEEGFSKNCGLSIRGGWSRHGEYPKHGFHLEFKSKYGPGKLKYPLFGTEGPDKFDKIDLRCDQNFSWNQGDPQSTYIRDVYSRDIQRDMGRPYTRSRYYHLYLNGMYWGLYQSQERVDDHYCNSHFGGEDEDYDVIKVNEYTLGVEFRVEAKHGNYDSWSRIYDMCSSGLENDEDYFALEGKDKNGNTNGSEVLVDVDNLIDYMLIIFYTGNYDAPCTITRQNQPNNFYAIDNRNDKTKGFVFFNYDGESTLVVDPIQTTWWYIEGLYENRVEANLMIADQEPQAKDFHPQWLHHKLTSNKEYRLRIADRIYQTFFNDGVFTPDNAKYRFEKRADEIDMAIIAESARWGDAKGTEYTKDDWEYQVNDLYNRYFPYRTDIVLQQLITAGLYPSIDPPSILVNNKEVHNDVYNVIGNYQISLNSAVGEIYYTTDETDPRMVGGQINPLAKKAINNEPIDLIGISHVKARVKQNDKWSALNAVNIFDYVGVKIVQNENIKVYPNPTNGLIYLKNVTDMDDVVIYNMEGRKVFRGKVDGAIDLNSLNFKYGLYLLKVKNSTFKIMYL